MNPVNDQRITSAEKQELAGAYRALLDLRRSLMTRAEGERYDPHISRLHASVTAAVNELYEGIHEAGLHPDTL